MDLLTYVGSWASIVGGIIALFAVAEKVATADLKDRFRNWLKNKPSSNSADRWPHQFADLFDRLFGSRHLTWRCFGLSSLASLIAVVIGGLTLAVISPVGFQLVLDYAKGNPEGSIMVFLSLTIALNFLPDYLSLLESRLILSLISKSDSLWVAILFLIIDLLATAFIWILFCFIFFVIVLWLGKPLPFPEAVGGTLAIFSEIWPINSWADYMLITYFGSTYFTSVWLWIYLVAGGMIKFGSFLRKGKALVFSGFDIDKYPITAIGFVGCLMVTICFVAYAPWAFEMFESAPTQQIMPVEKLDE